MKPESRSCGERESSGRAQESPRGPNGSRRGMLAGTGEPISRALGLTVPLKSATAARMVSFKPPEFDAAALVAELYSRIEHNWDRSENRGAELWRWVAQPMISAHNISPEKTLEKAIVRKSLDWVNQIPAASGLLRDCEERHANVDLGRRSGIRTFELVELKAGDNSDTPLWAAFEILRYALLYCFARLHRSELNMPQAYELMGAVRIDFKVLAPEDVYRGYRLNWLADALDLALREFARTRFETLALGFQFEAFPREFRWPCQPAELREMLAHRARFVFR